MPGSNEEIVRQGYKAFGEGDMDTLRSLFAADAVHSDSTSAWVASDPLRAAASLLQGARISSPARGSTRKATATSAGTSNGAGAGLEVPPRTARRARSRAVS